MERKFDELGRISIPREFRKKLNLENGAVANIELEDNKIIVTNPSAVDYKARIDKAIEWVRDWTHGTNDWFEEDSKPSELLDILKGE